MDVAEQCEPSSVELAIKPFQWPDDHCAPQYKVSQRAGQRGAKCSL